MKKNKFTAFKSAAMVFFVAMLLTACGSDISEPIENETQTESYAEEEKVYEQNEELYSALEELNNSCEAFYKKQKDTNSLLSVYSFLNVIDDQNNNVEVDVKFLKDNGYLNNEFGFNDIMILYVKKSDFFGGEDNSLEIFTAVKTTDGYVVSSIDNERTVVPVSDFSAIVLKYGFSHGEIINPIKNDDNYSGILEAVADFDKSDGMYIVRHMACDDLYASVVLSGKSSTIDIKEYALIKENGNWKVILADLQNEKNHKYAVNSQYSDFELGLLPVYNLYEYNGRISDNVDHILELLSAQNIITDSDLPVQYVCTTDKVFYIEFSSGRKMAGGADEDNSLVCDFVSDYAEAVKYIGAFEKTPPMFILKYEN